MEINIKYRTRTACPEDIQIINNLINKNPAISRRALSVEFCKEVGWSQPNGNLCDMVARGYMLALARAGHITLPPKMFFTIEKCTKFRPKTVPLNTKKINKF